MVDCYITNQSWKIKSGVFNGYKVNCALSLLWYTHSVFLVKYNMVRTNNEKIFSNITLPIAFKMDSICCKNILQWKVSLECKAFGARRLEGSLRIMESLFLGREEGWGLYEHSSGNTHQIPWGKKHICFLHLWTTSSYHCAWNRIDFQYIWWLHKWI